MNRVALIDPPRYGSLAPQAEAVLTEVVLLHMVAYHAITGPYKPHTSLLRSTARALSRAIFNRRKDCFS